MLPCTIPIYLPKVHLSLLFDFVEALLTAKDHATRRGSRLFASHVLFVARSAKLIGEDLHGFSFVCEVSGGPSPSHTQASD